MAEDLGADSVGERRRTFDERKGAVQMKEGAKLLVLAALAVLAAAIHRREKARLGRSWAGYGAHLLGLDMTGAGRKAYLDKLRFLAAFLVILVHSMEGTASAVLAGAALSPNSMPPVRWFLLTGFSSVGLCCNLLFVMISGALLLPWREESVGAFYQKRFSKVLIPLVLYYFFYLRRSGLLSFSPSSILDGLKTVISGPVELVPHFWLVYVMAGLYLGVPFLRWLFRNLPDKAFCGMAALIFIGAGIKTAAYLANLGFGFDSFLFSWTGIFILGYFLTCPCSKKYRPLILMGGGVSAVLVFLLFGLRQDAAAVAANDSLLMMLTASAVFVRFVMGEERRTEKQERSALGRKPSQNLFQSVPERSFQNVPERSSQSVPERSSQNVPEHSFQKVPERSSQSLPQRIFRCISALMRGVMQVIGRYSYSILLIHWYMLFVIVENHLHIAPGQLPAALLPVGILLQTGAALGLSLVFAVIFDQTAGVLALWLWEQIIRLIDRCFRPPTR